MEGFLRRQRQHGQSLATRYALRGQEPAITCRLPPIHTGYAEALGAAANGYSQVLGFVVEPQVQVW